MWLTEQEYRALSHWTHHTSYAEPILLRFWQSKLAYVIFNNDSLSQGHRQGHGLGHRRTDEVTDKMFITT